MFKWEIIVITCFETCHSWLKHWLIHIGFPWSYALRGGSSSVEESHTPVRWKELKIDTTWKVLSDNKYLEASKAKWNQRSPVEWIKCSLQNYRNVTEYKAVFLLSFPSTQILSKHNYLENMFCFLFFRKNHHII